MPREKKAAPAAVIDTADTHQISQAMALVRDDTVHSLQNAVALAKQFGYEGAVTPEVLEEQIRWGMRRSVEAVMATGACLLILRELSPHGQFLERVDRLGIDRRLAQRFMSASLKFGKAGNSPLLGAAGNVSKLLELTVLDDEEIGELAGGGTVRGLTVDKIDGMGFRELREALRESKAALQVANDARTRQQNKIDKLEREKKLFAKLPPDEELQRITTAALEVMRDARGCIRGQLRAACIALSNHGDEKGANEQLMAGLVGELQAALNELREEFALPDVSNLADQQLAGEVAQWSKKS